MRLSGIAVAIIAVAVALPGSAIAGDKEMAQRIANELKQSGKLVDYKVGVVYQDGTATLSGFVRSEKQHAAAIDLISAMPSVDHVIDEIEIIPSKTAKKTTSRSSKAIARTSAEEEMPVPVTAKTKSSKRGTRTASFEDTPLASAPANFSASDAREVPEPYYGGGASGAPMPMAAAGMGPGVAPVTYDQPNMPNYAWPSYAAYPNYGAVTYPKQYSPTAWPYIGPFYPYPQVPLGWRKVTLEWDDGWWFLDFDDVNQQHARRW